MTCTLITIPISHFCEKARWALERAGIPYSERRHLQGLHWVAVKRAGGGLTAPVLRCDDGLVLSESHDIVAWADERGSLGLYPDDEVRALERDFDARLGPEGRRWMYNEIEAGGRKLVVGYNVPGVPAWERRALPVLWPLAKVIIKRYLDITPETTAHSLAEVEATFEEVGERLSDGRPYLAGERFTAADLAFAALAAAVLMPPEYGVPLPQPDELPSPMGAKVREMREHPAGQHALRMFREERRA